MHRKVLKEFELHHFTACLWELKFSEKYCLKTFKEKKVQIFYIS